MGSNNIFFDENFTRYKLIKSNPGKIACNWLFLPGGPGIDSNYLLPLVKEIEVDGNCWVIDFLLNGSNLQDNTGLDPDKIYRKWGDYFLAAMNKFDNPILVGHSFAGYFPLFFPELEKILKGFVILSTAPIPPTLPTLNIDKFEKYAKENNLPFAANAVNAFLSVPTLNTAREQYLALVPYAFPEDTRAQGIKLIESLFINVDTAYWWITKGSKAYSTINWIPEKIPVLILGGTHDFITPLSLFEEDRRFHRNNIEIVNIPNAGHFPWIEQPIFIKDAFAHFSTNKIYKS